MSAPRAPGVELSVAGQRIASRPGTAPDDRPAQAAERSLSDWLRRQGDPQRQRGFGFRTVTQNDLLTGSSFALAAGKPSTGHFALWGRGAVTRFDGRDDDLTLDGEAASGLLGADWTRGAATAGLVMAHSRGEGGYRAPSETGGVTSSLTGLYPWGRYALSDRLSIWGLAGYGAGTLTLTPERRAPLRTDLDLAMAAAGLRGLLVEAPENGGLALAIKTDAMGVRTRTEAVRSENGNLAAAKAEVTRLRFGFEGSRPFPLGGGATLTPNFEIGVRHDGGDAETGFGIDVGGGIAWSDPRRGLSAALRGRGLLSHESEGFRERGIAGSLSWQPAGSSGRGPELTLHQTMGVQTTGGVDTLFGRSTVAGLAANDNDLRQRRFEVRFGYGIAAFSDRFTMTPEAGLALSTAGRDYNLGWRVSREGIEAEALELRVEVTRRENANDNADPEHAVGVKLTARF